MDEGFIAAIMRSPNLPPNDMWFAGYSINYYYYAHYTIAMLAKLLGQSPSIAFNTGICIIFGLWCGESVWDHVQLLSRGLAICVCRCNDTPVFCRSVLIVFFNLYCLLSLMGC